MNDLDTIFKTFDKIMESGFDVNKASLQNKVVVMITTAQGVIDNGGFQYFFEYDFGDAPNMQDFVMIYKEIGAEECAVAIEKALAIYNSKKQSTYDCA